ncbi:MULTISPECIES: haloacid dehalogenase type II [unclassified Achromobacter]|uniref:haloacid dehalogenase type II n=1 Tax=unclassified Achromobacter TaxID=2626865 RepID=UPI000B516AA2|nr:MULTISPECIES: haloacid dehalogenase type II [unclassified Achromobacter]OWT77373.1 haloacid dehalogenase, type II [Achromobacter sp. HZ28]OWT78254.1 haloacid dehalogenase, type II [Achromobacter sp. HZ34]
MELTDFKVLTFDCYGTLIDWETGIHNGLQPLLARHKAMLTKDQALEIFARHESDQQERTPDMPYSQLLSVVYRRLANEWAIPVMNAEANIFGASVPDWPEFPDSAEALAYLGKHYKLVILSNVDRISFRSSNQRLKVEFDAIYSAQDIGAYKPSRRNFDYMLAHLRADFGFEKADILHTAQSLYHDHASANAFGLASAWIDRRHDQAGWGATVPVARTPHVDFHFKSMAAMAQAHRQAMG